jgi:hypothetical protein
VIVLCLNDVPIGVFSTGDLANAAMFTDWKRREPKWAQLGLSVGQSCINNGFTVDPIRFTKYYYVQHEFAVDGVVL